MTKSNLNSHSCIKVLERWQRQEDSHKLIHVVDFSIRPQSKNFMLSVDIYIAGRSENYLDGITYYFYGSIVECVNEAIDTIENMKVEMRNKI